MIYERSFLCMSQLTVHKRTSLFVIYLSVKRKTPDRGGYAIRGGGTD